MTGIERIAAERKRQVEKEGWTPEHDEQHGSGELSMAAACYALPKGAAFVAFNGPNASPRTFDPWPWFVEYYRYTGFPPAMVRDADKRTQHDRLRSLEIAGALIAAEIDRILRSSKREGEGGL